MMVEECSNALFDIMEAVCSSLDPVNVTYSVLENTDDKYM